MVNDALNELFPVIDVENLNAELSRLSGWRLGIGAIQQNALAANFNLCQLFNPVGSGMLMVLERVDYRSGVAQNIRYGSTATALTNGTAANVLRDTREGILVQPVGQVRDVQQVGGFATQGILVCEAAVSFPLQDKYGLYVLAPGTGVTFAATTLNTTTTTSFQWRERVAEPAELNFP